MSNPPDSSPSFFDQVGGEQVFRIIAAKFYEGVSHDALLSPMYPKDDMDGAEERLRMFLEQYWGGPTSYSERRGHPRLRMRHMPFHINPEARDRWLKHMRAAVEAANLSELHEATMMDYFDRAAHSMVNTFD
jgi:hemoglobin